MAICNINANCFTPLSVDISPLKGRMLLIRFRAYPNFNLSLVQSDFPCIRGSVRRLTDEGVNVRNHLN